MTRKQAFWRLGLVLVVYLNLGVAHSLWLPLAHAPDEIDHFRYTHFIASHGRLPLTYEEREQAGNKAYLPALYHLLTAAVVGWSNSVSPPQLKLASESPRFDLVAAWFHTEYLINTQDELPPYQGVVLMWHLGRVVSLLIGAGVIIVAFFTTLEIFPNTYRLAVIASAITGFTPLFIFISASISYEPMVALMVGLYFWILVKIVKGDTRYRTYVWLGLLLGLSVTVKYVGIILPLQVMLVLALLARQNKWGWPGWFKRVAVTGLAAIVGSGWWFLFLAINFNRIDEFGWAIGLLESVIGGGTDTTLNYTAFFLSGGQIGRAGEISHPSFGVWAWQIFQSFWLQKVGYYPLSPPVFIFIGAICLVAAIGLVKAWQRIPRQRIWIILLVSHALFFLVLPFVRYLIQGELSHTAQGRHVLFPIATALPVLIVCGWQGWLAPRLQQRLALVFIAGLAVFSLVQLVYVAACCTDFLPVRTTADVVEQIPKRLDQTFGDHLLLLGYDSQIAPDEGALNLSLFWQSSGYVGEDYALQVDLVRNNESYLKWLAYPADGRYPTRIWENWETVIDRLSFPLFDLPPGDYQIYVQLLSYQGPLPVNGAARLLLGQITLPQVEPFEPEIALPITVDSREVVQGVSFWQTKDNRKLHQLEFKPRMTIPFVWKGQPDSGEQIKWRLVDGKGHSYPAQQAAPHFEYFTVGPNWQPGDYHLRAELWRDGTVIVSQETAPLVTIFNKEPRPVEPPPIPYRLEANFANRIALLGYNLPNRFVSPGQSIPVILYWQGLRTMEHNYTFFTKLLDSRQQQWAGTDRFARDGYKTSHWFENEVVIDQFELATDPDTPSGVYWFNVGLYLGLDQAAVSLPLIQNGQPIEATSVNFGPVKIGGPPPNVVVPEALPQNPLAVKLGDAIQLRGYDIARMDDALTITLYWESLAPLEADQTVFLHVRNEAEETIAQMDRPPVNGAYPTSLWEPGEIIKDEVVVPLPAELPSGNYSIVVGMYNFATGERLPIIESADNSATLLAMEIP